MRGGPSKEELVGVRGFPQALSDPKSIDVAVTLHMQDLGLFTDFDRKKEHSTLGS